LENTTVPEVTADDHTLGPAGALVTVLEYGDYECPFCRGAYRDVHRMLDLYPGSILFVFRNFPLNEIHPQAESAAETAEFAGTKGKYWEMHDLLFENQTCFSPPLFQELAGNLGLDPADLRRALSSGEFRAHVRSDFMSGARSGVNGTPTFFINGVRHDGAFDYEDLVDAIEQKLAA